MSELRLFMKNNKAKKENAFFPATKSLCDEQGNPLMWEIKPVTTKENNSIIDSCTYEVPVKGKYGMAKKQFDDKKYIARLICASVVNPNLNDKELQDSYGVMSAEELVTEMIDCPAEYADLGRFIQDYNGFTSLEEKVEKAKN